MIREVIEKIEFFRNRAKIYCFCLILAVIWSFYCPAVSDICAEEYKGLDLYFVRHAETIANVTGDYSEKNQKTFSDKGTEQIRQLSRGLRQYKFDHICVSPKYRARKTIEPYLKQNGLVAEIWPELAECCHQSDRNVSPTNIEPALGELISLTGDEKRYFFFRDGKEKDRLYLSGNYADGILQLRKAHELIIKRFGGSPQKVLLVGHGLAGGRIVELLRGLKPEGKAFTQNAKITLLRQGNDGKFKLIRFNADPLEKIVD